MDSVVIIMPAWNEAENIGRMIDQLQKEFLAIENEDFYGKRVKMHLLVVDNYSKDDMAAIVEKAKTTNPNIHLIQQGKKSGLGWAYVTGIKYAIEKLNANAVMEMDADGQHPPDHVKRMVKAYMKGADYVIGSRYIPGGSVPKEWAFARRAVSFLGNLYIRIVWLKPSLHDATTGFRLTRVDGVLDRIKLDELMALDRFAYKIDLLHQSVKNAKKWVEVPLEFKPRIKEKSKFNIKEMIISYKVATILGIKDRARFIKFGTVGFVGYLVNAIALKILTNLNAPGIIAWSLPVELAIISNFTLNNIWTFKKEKISGFIMVVRKFVEFNFTSFGALIIQTVAGNIGDKLFGINSRQLLLPFIIVFMVLPYNYFMYNTVIWKTWKLPWTKAKTT